jgi:hypothetical protein
MYPPSDWLGYMGHEICSVPLARFPQTTSTFMHTRQNVTCFSKFKDSSAAECLYAVTLPALGSFGPLPSKPLNATLRTFASESVLARKERQ